MGNSRNQLTPNPVKECPLGYYLEIKGMPLQWFSSLEKAKNAERMAFNHKLKSKIHPCENKPTSEIIYGFEKGNLE